MPIYCFCYFLPNDFIRIFSCIHGILPPHYKPQALLTQFPQGFLVGISSKQRNWNSPVYASKATFQSHKL